MDWASQVALVAKNLPAKAEDLRHVSSTSRKRRLSRGGYGNPLQFSCLENRLDREAWWATVHKVAKSQTQLK